MRYPLRLDKVWRPLLALFGGTPHRSYVELTPKSVQLRFGWLFNETIPRSEIEEAHPSSWPFLGGIGWRLGAGGRVGLIGSLRGIVELRLRTPRCVRCLIPWTARSIFVSLEDPQAFLAELQRVGSF